MKKHIFTLIVTVAVSLTSLSLSGCSGSSSFERVDCGKYGTIYQIFPYSFADSNGDGIGDIQGISDKLDYIYDLGFTGIWINPVQPSPTYHKYDTTDYYSIDPSFGTIDDYKAMVEKAHSLDLTVYLDLVINHTSTQHDWFKQSASAHVSGDTSNAYYDYYIWNEGGSGSNGTYSRYGSSNWYYSHYSGDTQMPRLNLQWVLDDPNCALAKELENIMEFWLVDCDVDGFRLDAVTSYFNGGSETTTFLTWLVDTARSYKEDCYIVGEGSWSSSSANAAYLDSGIDSFFCFDDAKATGYILKTLSGSNARLLANGINNNLSTFDNVNNIPSPFIVNHDCNGRLVSMANARKDTQNLKFAYATLQMYTGSTYHYYGDEIGMACASTTKDEDARAPFYWGDSYTPEYVANSTSISHDEAYPYGSANKLAKQKNSSVSYARKVNQVRNSHPAIFSGGIEEIYESNDRTFSANVKTCDSESLLILLNASKTDSYTYTNDTGYTSIIADLSTISGTKLQTSGNSLIIPPLSICILG